MIETTRRLRKGRDLQQKQNVPQQLLIKRQSIKVS